MTHQGDEGVVDEGVVLSLQAYAQFAGAPLKLRKTSNPWRSPCGEPLPFPHSPQHTYTRKVFDFRTIEHVALPIMPL